MSQTLAIVSNTNTLNITNTEALLTSVASVTNGSLANGDGWQISLAAGLVPGQAYNFNIRLGANGTTGDPVFMSVNNVVLTSNLMNDMNSRAAAFPGLDYSVMALQGYYNAANFPAVTTPVRAEGTFLLTINSIIANGDCNLALLAFPIPDANANNLFSTLHGPGPAAVVQEVTVIHTTANINLCNKIEVTGFLVGQNSLAFVGAQSGNSSTPGSAFNPVTAANANGVINWSMIETF